MEVPEGHEIAPGRTAEGTRRRQPLRGLPGLGPAPLHRDGRQDLRPDLVEEGYALRGLRREMEALELAHPVLLRAFDAYIEGPHPHVVVEHLEGPTLKRLIKRNGRLPRSRRCRSACTWPRSSTTWPRRAGSTWT